MKFVKMVSTFQVKINVLINNHKVCKTFFRSSSAPTDGYTQGNSRLNEKQILQDSLEIPEDTILNYPKKSIIAYLNLNSLRNKINDLSILIQDISLDYFVLSKTKLDRS